MNRAERRRLDRELKNGKSRLDSLPGIMAPVEMTPTRIAVVMEEVKRDLIGRYGDKAGLQLAREESYEAGHADGEKFAQQHYLQLVYICMGLAMCECYGFKARRIAKVWHKTDEIYSEILSLLDDDLPLEEAEEMFKARLARLTGLEFSLTHSTEELREKS